MELSEQIQKALEEGKIKPPRDVLVSGTCICQATLGRFELEAVAACIVLYHWEHSPDRWVPITRRQIADWIPTSSALARVMGNPFWQIDIAGFCDQGFIEGWEQCGIEGADTPGMVTLKFLEMVSFPKMTLKDVVYTDLSKKTPTPSFETTILENGDGECEEDAEH
jgi:hypothetical protein